MAIGAELKACLMLFGLGLIVCGCQLLLKREKTAASRRRALQGEKDPMPFWALVTLSILAGVICFYLVRFLAT